MKLTMMVHAVQHIHEKFLTPEKDGEHKGSQRSKSNDQNCSLLCILYVHRDMWK